MAGLAKTIRRCGQLMLRGCADCIDRGLRQVQIPDGLSILKQEIKKAPQVIVSGRAETDLKGHPASCVFIGLPATVAMSVRVRECPSICETADRLMLVNAEIVTPFNRDLPCGAYDMR